MMEEKLQKYYSRFKQEATDGLDKGTDALFNVFGSSTGRKKRKQKRTPLTSYHHHCHLLILQKTKKEALGELRTERRQGVGLLDVIAEVSQEKWQSGGFGSSSSVVSGLALEAVALAVADSGGGSGGVGNQC
jgi:hypothetical protein